MTEACISRRYVLKLCGASIIVRNGQFRKFRGSAPDSPGSWTVGFSLGLSDYRYEYDSLNYVDHTQIAL